ncbi:MAG TPA: hypothetical protein VH301_16870, partial [Usitatibacter sp.]|nr:hypothetical protein [Usitatibacter sp.]
MRLLARLVHRRALRGDFVPGAFDLGRAALDGVGRRCGLDRARFTRRALGALSTLLTALRSALATLTPAAATAPAAASAFSGFACGRIVHRLRFQARGLGIGGDLLARRLGRTGRAVLLLRSAPFAARLLLLRLLALGAACLSAAFTTAFAPAFTTAFAPALTTSFVPAFTTTFASALTTAAATATGAFLAPARIRAASVASPLLAVAASLRLACAALLEGGLGRCGARFSGRGLRGFPEP